MFLSSSGHSSSYVEVVDEDDDQISEDEEDSSLFRTIGRHKYINTSLCSVDSEDSSNDQFTPLNAARKQFNFPLWADADKYQKVKKIGQGSFGEVFKAREKKSGKVVAMKKVLMDNEHEGFPITALREITILQRLKHDNVINLIEVCGANGHFYLVFDFCDHDLGGILDNKSLFLSLPEIKVIMKQLFEALYYIHNNKFLHRDLKPPNILVNNSGILKLADFGLSRAVRTSTGNRLTSVVVTLWYRAPEVLMGVPEYGAAVDMWAAGCVMAELWLRAPLFPGETEQRQLELIAELCGTIEYPGVVEVIPGKKKRMRIVDPLGRDLVDKLLVLDPDERLDAGRVLEHDFFWRDPMPGDLRNMLERLRSRGRQAFGPHVASIEGGYHEMIF